MPRGPPRGPPGGAPAAYRDIATTAGQRYYSELVTQERRIRGVWQNEYAHREHAERAMELRDWNAPPVARSTASDPPSQPHTPHRMGAGRALAPLSAYERSLRDWHADGTHPRELFMSTLYAPKPGYMVRLFRHHTGDSAEGALARLAPPSSRGAESPGRSEFEHPRRRVQTAATLLGEGNSPQLKRVTAEERRQQAFEGAAGKPHPRNFGAGHMPPGFNDRRPPAERWHGMYRPTEADLSQIRVRQAREQQRLRATLEKTLGRGDAM
ncbi:hypothetical protein T492DRAFT_991380 [Pavlovales sp. CCMP2436]|nr:hypothetical protein T492DRAFT_991380 [Pavlovales sp. CCMP2436]